MLAFLVVFVTVYFWSAIPLMHIQATFKGAITPGPLTQLFLAFWYWRLALSLTTALSYATLR